MKCTGVCGVGQVAVGQLVDGKPPLSGDGCCPKRHEGGGLCYRSVCVCVCVCVCVHVCEVVSVPAVHDLLRSSSFNCMRLQNVCVNVCICVYRALVHERMHSFA